jgi:hypothetical protein
MRLLISCLVCVMFIVPDCMSQATDTSFSLLWFKGKKINDSTLSTPNGRRVTYQPSRGRAEIGMPDKNNVFERIQRMLQQSGQRKSDLARTVLRAQHGTLKIGFVRHINQAMDEVDRPAEKLAGTKLELETEETRRMPLGEGSDLPPYIEMYYNQVLQYVASLSSTSIPEPPVPPGRGLDYCSPCDAGRKAAYAQQEEAFYQYLEKEREQMEKAIAVMHYFTKRKFKQQPYDSAAEARMMPRMKQAMRFILTRIGAKMMKVWNKYKNDADKLPFLAEQMLAFIRAEELTGINAYEGFPSPGEISQQCVFTALKQVDTAKQKRDYRILLNVRWIVGLYRSAELCGMDQSGFENGLTDFLRINHFELSVQADATMGKENTEMSANMSGKNVFGAAPDSNCVLKWTLLSPDSTKMKYTLEEASMILPKTEAVYTGTYNWKTTPATLMLDFCKAEKDTAMLYGFMPDEGKETWVVGGQTLQSPNNISSIYMHCFMDVKRMRAIAADPATLARLQQQMQEKYKEFMAAYQASGNDPSKMSPKEMEKMAEAMNASKDISYIVQSVSPLSFLCKERLRNNQKTVFEVKLNGKELFPENTGIKEAIFTVKIEHVE